jgi:hypothetical protein
MTILYQGSTCPHRSPAARVVRKVLVACAAGGKGGPPPLHPGQELRPLEPQNDVTIWGGTDADGSVVLSHSIYRYHGSAHRSHASVLQSCGKHHVQGVWGAARHPSGEREGYPLGVEPARIL